MKNLTAVGSSFPVQRSLVDGVDLINEATFELAFQDAANRAEYLKDLCETTGPRRIETVANITALKAISTSSGLNNAIVAVEAGTYPNSIYQYDFSATESEQQPFCITPDSSTGRWFLVNKSSIVHDGWGDYKVKDELIRNQTFLTVANLLGASNAPYTASAGTQISNTTLDLGPCLTGDQIHWAACFRGRLVSGSTGYGYIRARLWDGSSYVATLGDDGYCTRVSGSSPPLENIPLGGRYTITTGASYQIHFFAYVSVNAEDFRVSHSAGDLHAWGFRP